MSETIRISPDMVPMRDISMISEGDRVFYEIGEKININKPNSKWNWIPSGQFKEIIDVKDFLAHDNRLSDPEYLDHHNFMLIKN